MAAALECWSGRPSTDEDVAEQVLMPNPLRSNTTTSSPKKWHRLLQTLTSLKSSIIDEFKLNTIPIPIPKNQEQQQLPHQWGTLIRDLTHLYPGSQLPEKLISDLRRHFHSLPHSYALAAFPIKDTLLHLRLLHQSASSDQLAVHIQQLKDGREIHQITFACNHPISLPTVSTLLNVSCTTRNVQVFEKKGVTLGVVETQTLLVEEGQRETIKERVENALRSAMKKPVKKIPFGFCGCQEQEEDGLVRGDRIGVDEWQNVKTGTEEISRWILDSMEVEFGEQMGVSSFKGGYRGKKVWIRKMKGCERGSAYEVEIRHDLVRLMCCGHRNLVEFVGVCVEERYGFCVVTKMVEGGSLRDLIERRRKVEGKEVVRIALDVAEGLMFMNGQGVAYRDLNVSRVLLDKQGNALLGDMGIVASCNNGGEVTEYETAGYRWLAPEIIAGDPESVTETWMSNVYSFGMVIWEMVTGEEAYSSYSPVQAAVGIAACGLRPEIPKDCPQVLRSLMIKCWNKCPSKRPQFSEIISILQKQNNR